jgi:hypothetical protein
MKLHFAWAGMTVLLILTIGSANVGECYRCCKEIHTVIMGETCLYFYEPRCNDCASGDSCLGGTAPYDECTDYHWKTKFAEADGCSCYCPDNDVSEAYALSHGEWLGEMSPKVCP